MTFEEVKYRCHVRSAIRRKSKPNIKYWKNNLKTLDEQVPYVDKLFEDWEEFDPREHEECAEYNEMPA